MPAGRKPTSLWDKIARLLTSGPPPTDILMYRLPRSIERRARQLLAKSNACHLNPDEDRELVQLEQAELFMRLVKARLRRRADGDA